jgi:hypothetical protein
MVFIGRVDPRPKGWLPRGQSSSEEASTGGQPGRQAGPSETTCFVLVCQGDRGLTPTPGPELRFRTRWGPDSRLEPSGTGSTGYRLLSGYTLKQGESS